MTHIFIDPTNVGYPRGDDDSSLLSEEELTAYMKGLLQRDANGNYKDFYFVLIDAIEQLLSTVKAYDITS